MIISDQNENMGLASSNSAPNRFSIFTNASAKDAPRLEVVIPHWLRIFSHCLDEIFILLDTRLPEGRISLQHAIPPDLDRVERLLNAFAGQDRRVRWSRLDYARLPEISRQWWTAGQPVRCQDGTPVFAFAAGFEQMKGKFVLRSDCDMLFYDAGWVQESLRLLGAGQCNIVSPPRLGDTVFRLSSRALMFDHAAFQERFLPMRPARLDWVRQVHRRWHGRPTWMAFEDSLGDLVRAGTVKFSVLPSSLGTSMHVARVDAFIDHRFPSVVERWERNLVPSLQRENGWDYLPGAWGTVSGNLSVG